MLRFCWAQEGKGCVCEEGDKTRLAGAERAEGAQATRHAQGTTYVELLDVLAERVLGRHNVGPDDLDAARAATVAGSHLTVCIELKGTRRETVGGRDGEWQPRCRVHVVSVPHAT